ncbi:phage portal protein [Pseudoxanthobacter sp. M-2]|uniref:phage portal protein n=1 Tax=Pseudoxanthobacter sp. M-2 TaxID=3078754 RepID=UPI0038FD03EF
MSPTASQLPVPNRALACTWLDRVIGAVSPSREAARVAARIRTATMLRAYDGAAGGRRFDGWPTPSTSADAEIGLSLARLRARCRDLSRNNPHAKRAVTVWTTNLVGDGIVPRAKTGKASLDSKVDALFAAFVETCDAGGQLDFFGLQALAVRGMIDGGETLLRRRWRRGDDGLPVPVQFQVMEGDHLDHDKTTAFETGARIVQGVEFDAIGRRSAYWMFRDHPGDSVASLRGGLASRPVPASEVAHLHLKERTQTRGVPWGHAVLQRLRDLDDYEDAEIMRKKVEACVVAFVLGQTPEDVEDGQSIAPEVVTQGGLAIEKFEPGLIARVKGGTDVKFSSPSGSSGFPAYIKAGLHSIAAGYELPYALLSGDLSEVNFSSSRVGLVEFRRLVTQRQWQCVIKMACQPMWDWFIEAAQLVGKLPAAPIPCEWQPPAFESVNPLDDANADMVNVRSGKVTMPELIAKTGRNPDDVLAEHAAWKQKVDDAGLVFDSDPSQVARAGTEQPSITAGDKPAPRTAPAA